jgi:hypothetical protein
MSKLTASTAAAEKHAKLINEAWQKTVPAIVETGRRIVEARDKLEHGEFQNLIPMLNCGRSTAFALIKIASHPVLSKVQHVGLLPPSWGTLAELARLDGKKLEAAIEKGTVHPQMERKDVAALLRPPKEKAKESKLPLGWRRQPLTDCPICGGTGTQPAFRLTSECGRPEFGGEPVTGPCPCVQSEGDSHTPEFRAMLREVRENIDLNRRLDAAGAELEPEDDELLPELTAEDEQEIKQIFADVERLAVRIRKFHLDTLGHELARKLISAQQADTLKEAFDEVAAFCTVFHFSWFFQPTADDYKAVGVEHGGEKRTSFAQDQAAKAAAKTRILGNGAAA